MEDVVRNLQCKRCGADMVKRFRKSDGHQFYGCTRYPKCTCTKTEDPYDYCDDNAADYFDLGHPSDYGDN